MFHPSIHPSMHSFIVLKMCNISTESQKCYLVWKLYIPVMVPIAETIPTIQEKNLGSTVHSNTNVRFTQKDLKKKKRLKKNSFPFYSCSTEEINSHNDIFTHRNENPAEALLNWYLFCTILDEDTDLVLVIQLLSSSVRGR